jgi:hypothetical protein
MFENAGHPGAVTRGDGDGLRWGTGRDRAAPAVGRTITAGKESM